MWFEKDFNPIGIAFARDFQTDKRSAVYWLCILGKRGKGSAYKNSSDFQTFSPRRNKWDNKVYKLEGWGDGNKTENQI